MTAWGIALLLGLGFTKVDWFTGPLVSTWIGENGLGWAATVLLAALLFAVLPEPREGAAGAGTKGAAAGSGAKGAAGAGAKGTPASSDEGAAASSEGAAASGEGAAGR